METKLTIRWDGDLPSLKKHRLSLDAWLVPLQTLLRAMRRTASAMVVEAVDPQYGTGGGRFAHAAERIDLELEAVTDGCVTIRCFVAGDDSPQAPLFPGNDLPTRAAARLLEDIEAEASGKIQSFMAREYLKSLPTGVTQHDYDLSQGGTKVKTVHVQGTLASEIPAEMPKLLHVRGKVAAVAFEPSSVTIRADVEEGRRITARCPEELVDKAIALRHSDVVALVSAGIGNRCRLVWIRDAAEHRQVPGADDRAQALSEAWSTTLAILAR